MVFDPWKIATVKCIAVICRMIDVQFGFNIKSKEIISTLT